MTRKIPIDCRRLRRVPKQFSRLDQRLVRSRLIEKCSHQALALYLFLVVVGDAEGLSYYSDRSIAAYFHLDDASLDQARQNLIETQLIAYHKPLYQVLSLDTGRQQGPVPCPCHETSREQAAVARMLKQWLEAMS